MPEAWEYSIGDEKFLLGISDAGFDTLHDDLDGRFASILTSASHSHGMAVTGTMAAKSDNGIGISGINWKNQVVASYMGGQYVEDIITTQKDNKEVRLVSNSWGYHIPSNFDYSNQSVRTQRFETMQNIYAQIRQMATHYDNKLFLWAAGNGIGNGLGNNGVYGIDAKYDNGALHYKNSVISRLENLLVVGAFVQDSRVNGNDSKVALRYYSNYGESVDIAAPTEFESLSLNNGKYSSFGGTSAATPVVSSIASLIMAINPNLTPADIKEILISSATEYITQRQSSPGGALEYLQIPIPIINAQEALKRHKRV
jgi:subtilisin family serine protease